MSFTIDSGTTEVWSCTECTYCSTKRHFATTEDKTVCILCKSKAEPVDEIEQSTGMSSFKYRSLLDTLEDEASGVGNGTKVSLSEHFDDGDSFLDTVERAYQEAEYSSLTEVDGVGETTAENIALTIAEVESWSGGKAEMTFDLS